MQRAARSPLHHQIWTSRFERAIDRDQVFGQLAMVEHAHDVWVIERRGDPQFVPEESAIARFTSALGGEHFDCDGHSGLAVHTAPDDRHASLPGTLDQFKRP
jgi:hypothetical protein